MDAPLGTGSLITRTNSTPTTIANDTTSVSTIVVSPNDGGRVAKLRLKLDIVHPANNELRARLVAPNGRETLLFSHVGGTQGFPNVTFDDDATLRLIDVGAPYNYTNGAYRPVDSFSASARVWAIPNRRK